MVISLENRYIFIAVPKTGTTSIQKFLLKHDPTAKRYRIEIEGKKYSFGEHDTALQIKRELGGDYSKFRTFGFIRNPHSRIVSSYFFYKNGKPITSGNKNPWPAWIRTLYARVMPFEIWALSYPYKSNIEHFVDEKNNLIVDFIGTFENLHYDLAKIFNSLGLDLPVEELPHTNKSTHSLVKEYFRNKNFNKSVSRIIREDLNFYNNYKFNL